MLIIRLPDTVLIPNDVNWDACTVVVGPPSLFTTTPRPEGKAEKVVPETVTISPPPVIVAPAKATP